eukprot:4409089-Amphidinium_carterae.1
MREKERERERETTACNNSIPKVSLPETILWCTIKLKQEAKMRFNSNLTGDVLHMTWGMF